MGTRFFGADNEIRTHDLVITNDVLCQLSYISAFGIISKKIRIVKQKKKIHPLTLLFFYDTINSINSLLSSKEGYRYELLRIFL